MCACARARVCVAVCVLFLFVKHSKVVSLSRHPSDKGLIVFSAEAIDWWAIIGDLRCQREPELAIDRSLFAVNGVTSVNADWLMKSLEAKYDGWWRARYTEVPVLPMVVSCGQRSPGRPIPPRKSGVDLSWGWQSELLSPARRWYHWLRGHLNKVAADYRLLNCTTGGHYHLPKALRYLIRVARLA